MLVGVWEGELILDALLLGEVGLFGKDGVLRELELASLRRLHMSLRCRFVSSRISSLLDM